MTASAMPKTTAKADFVRMKQSEVLSIRERYDRRAGMGNSLYAWTRAEVLASGQELDRALWGLLKQAGIQDFRSARLLEVGCGAGGNLMRFLRWGFSPDNVVGNELLDERVEQARRTLPAELKIIAGDATRMQLPNQFDVVHQSTVFSSILDDAFQQRLAERMWSLAKPGGGILWYDFVYDNPRNPDVRGVTLGRIRELFPEGRITSRRVTLAPPIARRIASLGPLVYDAVNLLPMLRTHMAVWIAKPAG